MNKENPELVEQEFFRALIEADAATLERLLADDCLLIDVMSGSEGPKAALIDTIASRQLRFDQINRIDYRVRPYGMVAIVTGQTEMSGSLDGQPFKVPSRYTHVFVDQGYGWRMATAQGTQIVALPGRNSTPTTFRSQVSFVSCVPMIPGMLLARPIQSTAASQPPERENANKSAAYDSQTACHGGRQCDGM